MDTWTLIWIIVTPLPNGDNEFISTREPMADFALCAEKLAEKEAELNVSLKPGTAFTIYCKQE